MAAPPSPGNDSSMLRGETGQTVADIDTLTPMTADEETAAQQLYGTDYRQWPALQQQQWLRRLPEDDRKEYIDSDTWRLYQTSLNSTTAVAGLSPEEEAQIYEDLEQLALMTDAEREWMVRHFGSENPKDWSPLVRRLYIRSLDRSQWIAELMMLEPPPQRPLCNGCRLTNDVFCDADLGIGLGCTQCRQRRRRCMCAGRRLVDRPLPERNFRLKCHNCQQSGEECEWLAAAMNLHSACGNCVRKGVDCMPQAEGSPDPPPDAPAEVAPGPLQPRMCTCFLF